MNNLVFLGSRHDLKDVRLHKTIRLAVKRTLKYFSVSDSHVYLGLTYPLGLIVADECIKNKMAYTVAVAFRDEYLRYKTHNRDLYRRYIKRAHQVIKVDRQFGYLQFCRVYDTYRRHKYFDRDSWLFRRLQTEADLGILFCSDSKNIKTPILTYMQNVYLPTFKSHIRLFEVNEHTYNMQDGLRFMNHDVPF